MKRLSLLVYMTALAIAVVCVVVYASPYAPVVQPCPENIEDIWAIEDAREESETPLLTALENNGVALGYDWYENTFYCTLGMENADEWPQIHLTAPGAKGLEICFVDDYTYDWCADAIRENYAYEMIIYNDQVYSYAKIVFTGLPILSLKAKTEIPAHTDLAAELSWSYGVKDGLYAYVRTHKRGASSLFFENPKVGYKVEFTRSADGSRKTQMPVEDMGMTDEFILIPCLNTMMMQDRLCWDIYGMLNGEQVAFGKRDLFYTELFINNEYQGVFLAMKPFDYAMELRKEGQFAAETDSIYRTIAINPLEKERLLYVDEDGMDYELYYTTKPAGQEFEPLQGFIEAFSNAYEQTEQADTAFCMAMADQIDIDSFLRYFLYVQACGLKDNLINNMYIWARYTDAGYQFRLFPWDLNVSWGGSSENYDDQKWTLLPPFDRAIELDCGGLIRDRMLEIWKEMRERVFTVEMVEELINQYTYELGESGAFYRDANRWGKSVFYPDGYSISDYARLRFEMLDKRIEEMASEELRGRMLEIGEYETIDAGELKSEMVKH